MTIILLASYWLQSHDLSRLRLTSDSAYSVFSANQNLQQIATNRVYDGHPPLYYYLLHFWMLLGGDGELSVRLLSVCFGMAAVAAGYALGRRLAGPSLGLLASLLLALSPELVYYDRLVRMYSGLACLSLVSCYLFLLLLERPSRARLATYGATTLLAAFSHYYAILLALAQGLWWGWRCLRGKGLWRLWVAVYGPIVLVYAPWLAYAGATQAAATAPIIDIAPPAQGLLGFLQQLWIPFNLGATLDRRLAGWLSLLVAAVLVAALLFVLRHGQVPQGQRTLAFLLALVLVFSLAIFAAYPAAVRPRHLLVALPLFLVLAAWLCLRFVEILPLAGLAGLALIVGLDGFALSDTYAVQAHMAEPDAIQVTQTLEQLASAGDMVVFHASWEAGYFEAHYQGPRVTVETLSDINQLQPSRDFAGRQRVWLSIYGARPRDPRYPLEDWLDRHWPKLDQWQFGPNRLSLYAEPAAGGAENVLDASLGLAEGHALIRVQRADVVRRNHTVVVQTLLTPLQAIRQPLTFFVHLTDDHGNRIAGHDIEPEAGANPATNWIAGSSMDEQFGLLVPKDVPPGEYNVELGVYPTGSASDFWTSGPRGPEGHLEVGKVELGPLRQRDVRPPHEATVLFDGGLTLLGYKLDLDDYAIESRRLVHAALGEDITTYHRRSAYRPGETVNLTLYWQRTGGAEDVTLFGHLVDSSGTLRAQHDQPLTWGGLPDSAWPLRSVAVTHEAIPLPENIRPGTYRLRIGLYREPSLRRLPVAGQNQDEILLQEIAVGPRL